MRIRFDGPSHRLDAYGLVVQRGGEAEFSEQEVAVLQAEPLIRVTVLDAPAKKQKPRRDPGRAEAHAAGSKRSAGGASASAEPEAPRGEGQPTSSDTKE